MTDMVIRFGIIGCGMISAFHMDAIAALEDAELAGVYDQNTELAGSIALRYGTRRFESLQSLLEDAHIDAVCICTPSGLHARQALEAVRAGKHVLIEKPMALTLADCDSILYAARESGVRVGVVSQTRFAPSIRQVKKALEDGLLGRIVCADLSMKYFRPQAYYDNGAWRGTMAMDGGGALMNQGIHGVDLMRYLLGPLRSITAIGGTFAHDIEVEDTLCALVAYQNGAVGMIQAATSTFPGFPRRIEFNGTQGCILLEEERIVRWEVEGCPYYASAPQEDASGGFRDPTQINPQGHLQQMRNFISAVRDDTPLASDGCEGRATLKIILSAYDSMRTGETVRFADENGVLR